MLELNDEGFEISIDLSNHLSINQMSSYIKNLPSGSRSLENIFMDALTDGGDIDYPKLRFDSRFSPYLDRKDFNSYLKDYL